MGQRETWGTRMGFIMAAIGSAIGLGNIWRFPYMAVENGGGAFYIPYLFALLTAGIPIMILEFGLGHKFRGSAPLTFARISRKWEWLGWWQALVCFFISVYYVIIIAWAICYVGFSLTQAWGDNALGFFLHDFLNYMNADLSAKTGSPLEFVGFQSGLLLAFIISWGVTFLALYGGIRGGIERACKIMMPLLFIMTLVMVIRGVTLPGAAVGINYLLEPDFSRIFDAKVWTAAYGQIFFTLSIGFAIMIAYSSYLPKKSDIVNNAFMTSLINCGYSLLAGLATFSVLGHMAVTSGQDVAEVAGSGGLGMAFWTFPTAISSLGSFAPIFGALFFLTLVFAGFSSQISICEAAISSFMDKFNMERKKAVIIYTVVAVCCSLMFLDATGLDRLDLIDYFTNQLGIVFGGLIEVVLIAWFFKLKTIQDHINPISEFTAGKWWVVAIKYITPIVLGYMAIAKTYSTITEGYGGFTTTELLAFGGLTMGVIFFGALILSSLKWKDEQSVVKGVDM